MERLSPCANCSSITDGPFLTYLHLTTFRSVDHAQSFKTRAKFVRFLLPILFLNIHRNFCSRHKTNRIKCMHCSLWIFFAGNSLFLRFENDLSKISTNLRFFLVCAVITLSTFVRLEANCPIWAWAMGCSVELDQKTRI